MREEKVTSSIVAMRTSRKKRKMKRKKAAVAKQVESRSVHHACEDPNPSRHALQKYKNETLRDDESLRIP